MRRRIVKAGITIVENAAGLEWKRTKWNRLVQVYLWFSALLMAKASDYLVCDSEGILTEYDKMIRSSRPIKRFIPYGTDLLPPLSEDMPERVKSFFEGHGIYPYSYYLDISRLVPENSYQLILNEFMKSNTECSLILVNNYQKESAFYKKLKKQTGFESDKRIQFVGAIYDKELLNYLRKYCRGYINGHTLGGTNPGLLEALASADVTLAFDVVFSRQVADDCAIYYNQHHSLSSAISQCDALTDADRERFGTSAKNRMKELYSWQHIVNEYGILFHQIYDAQSMKAK
jgi:rhamnosyltransferase